MGIAEGSRWKDCCRSVAKLLIIVIVVSIVIVSIVIVIIVIN